MTGRRHLSDAQVAGIEERRERGFSYERIARAVGCSSGAVRYHCLKLGVETPAAGYAKPPLLISTMVRRGDHTVRRFSHDEDRLIVQRAAEGASLSAIGREIGRRHNSIIGRLMTLARHDSLLERRA